MIAFSGGRGEFSRKNQKPPSEFLAGPPPHPPLHCRQNGWSSEEQVGRVAGFQLRHKKVILSFVGNFLQWQKFSDTDLSFSRDSRREEYVRLLKKHIAVDILGKSWFQTTWLSSSSLKSPLSSLLSLLRSQSSSWPSKPSKCDHHQGEKSGSSTQQNIYTIYIVYKYKYKYTQIIMWLGECGREIWEFNTATHKKRFQTLAQNYKLDDSYDSNED